MDAVTALGIDVGSTTTKAALVEVADGAVRERGVRVVATAARPQTLLEELADACRDLLAGVAPVRAVGVASMAETGVPVDREGRPLTELLRWDAGLGRTDAERLHAHAAAVFAATGVRLAAKTPLATWAWLRRERPDVLRRTARWLGAADLVVHALTGEHVTDHTLAGRTGGYRLPEGSEPPPPAFDPELLALAGMPPDRLPRVAGPTDVAGAVRPSAAARFGVAADTPVAVAGHDHQVAAWGLGARTPGQLTDSLGTAEAVLGLLAGRPDPERVRAQGMSIVRTPAGQEALISGSSSAGAMLRGWLDTVPAERRDAVLLDAARDAAASGPTGAAVAPYLQGRQTPAPDPHARAGRPPTDRPRPWQARAVVEGICYQARWMVASQAALGVPVERVTVVAGDRLPLLWTELKRVTLPWPVRRSRAAEPVASGAAVLALARSGALGPPSEALATAPVLAHEDLPRPDGDPHAAAFEAFVAAAAAVD